MAGARTRGRAKLASSTQSATGRPALIVSTACAAHAKRSNDDSGGWWAAPPLGDVRVEPAPRGIGHRGGRQQLAFGEASEFRVVGSQFAGR
jgi:hypothetical protein